MNTKMQYQKEKEKAIIERIEQGLKKDGFFYIKMKNGEEIHAREYKIEYYEGKAYLFISSLDKSTYIIIKVRDILFAI